jgi:hypothetical protein
LIAVEILVSSTDSAPSGSVVRKTDSEMDKKQLI